jgi:pimeloyl-ACP methyl ester carboxylesterase
MLEGVYQPQVESRIDVLPVNDAQYSVRSWGPPDATPLVLLHGTRDTSVTFQFLVDSMAHSWRIVAPDLRGHGGTPGVERCGWFHDYLADIEVLLESLFPARAVNLVGHSLGGNLASTLAGLCPGRVHRLVVLDAFGIMPPTPTAFVDVMTRWLNGVEDPSRQQKSYASFELMAKALQRSNPRLPEDKALYLAANSARPCHPQGYTWLFDSTTHRSIPTFHSLDEWIACWKRIEAPTLWVASSDPLVGSVRSDPDAFRYVLEHIGRERLATMPNTGHNLHHDAPGPLAELIETFLTGAQIHGRADIVAGRGARHRPCDRAGMKV